MKTIIQISCKSPPILTYQRPRRTVLWGFLFPFLKLPLDIYSKTCYNTKLKLHFIFNWEKTMAVYKTENREMLLGFLEQHSGDAFTVRQLASELTARGSHGAMSESTVYRLLRELEKDGKVQKTIDPDNREYMYIYESAGSRVNMRCKVCGNVYAADSETSRKIIADVAGCGEAGSGEDIELLIKCKHCREE